MPVQLNLIFASTTTAGNNHVHDTGSNVPVNRIVSDSDNYKKRSEAPLIDITVGLICFALLVSLALLIESNMEEANSDDDHNQTIALSLIIAFILVSVFVCIYATHRMGVCMWTGPLQSADDDSLHQTEGQIDFSPECSYVIDLPPCYKSIIDESPPSYESVAAKYKLENCVVNTHDINHI